MSYLTPPVVYLEKSDFDANLNPKLAASGKPVLLLLQGNFCGFCNKSKPDYQQVANQLQSRAHVCTVQIDEDKDIGSLLSDKLNVVGVPTVVMYKPGHGYIKHEGSPSKEELIEFFNRNA